MKMNNPWVTLGVLAVVLIGGSIGYAQYAGSKADEGVEIQAHIKGNVDGEVALVEYSDFECPACAAFAPTVAQIMDLYGDQISFEYRHFPVINRNPQVLLAAEAAGQQGQFFPYHDLLFENQQEWLQSGNVDRFLRQYAEELDLDMDQWERQRRSTALRGKIQDDFTQGRSEGVTGTPTFFVNGERVNFETFDDLPRAVEAVLGIEPTESAGMQTIEINPEDLGIEFNDAGEAVELEVGDPETSPSAEGNSNVQFGF